MSAEASIADSSRLCGLCNNNSSKYCCPRCDVFYCSLDCYKSEKHASCSESFYEDCVHEELASMPNDDESKRKMIAILKRMRGEGLEELDLDGIDDLEDIGEEEEDEADSDDNEDQDLEERIKDLNLDDADAVWNVLTEDERNEFTAIMNQGDVGSMVPQWDPWWSYSKDATLVQPLEEVLEQVVIKKCPEIITVPDFSTLTTIDPSPSIRYNITNVLSSYAFIMRYFNGELEPTEWTSYLLDICSNLDSNYNFEDAAMAVESVKQKCLQSQIIETDAASLDVMKRDTFSLLQGPSEENKLYYSQAALSHIQTILSQAKSALKQRKDDERTKTPEENPEKSTEKIKSEFSKKFLDNKGDYLPKLDSSKLKKCIKKVEFYLSFVNSYGLDYE